MDHKNEEFIVNISITNINELFCIICEVDFIEVQDSLAKSSFHWQTMKCRLIIHTIPEVIASPVLGTDKLIYIITTKEFIKTSKLFDTLKSFNVLFGEPISVTTDAYVACLSYTIQCKIAPSWNKIGQYYVYGKDFYNITKELNSIKLQVSINDESAQLRLQVAKIKIQFVQLENFYLLRSSMAEFLADSNSSINLNEYSQSVQVLPSMKRAKVVSVSKKIPSSCPFKNYEQMRRHWKNMYGYQLPETEERILFYGIKFPVPGSNIFIYPNTCLTIGPLQFVQCKDTESIVAQFLDNMISSVSNICNTKLKICINSDKQDFQKYLLNNNIKVTNNQKYTQLLSLKSDGTFLTNANVNSSKLPTKLTLSNTLQQKQLVLSPEKCLSKIKQIHNSNFAFNKRSKKNVNVNNDQENDVDLTYITGNSTYEDDVKIDTEHSDNPFTFHTEYKNKTESTVKQNKTISKYFKSQKSHLQYNQFHDASKNIFGKITLKEKLMNAKCGVSTEYSIDLKTLAKENKLGEVPNATLSNWLKERCIPHNSHNKKCDLIDKVLQQIRNEKTIEFNMKK